MPEVRPFLLSPTAGQAGATTSSSCSEVKGQSSAEVLKENSTLGGKDTFMPDSILRNVNIQAKGKSSIPWCLPPERGLHQGSRQVRI